MTTVTTKSLESAAEKAPPAVARDAEAPQAAPPPAPIATADAPAAPPAALRPARRGVLDLLAADPVVRALLAPSGEGACAIARLRQTLFPAPGAGPRTLLVAGVRRGDGATTVAAALALALARTLDDAATLVDAHLVRPRAGAAAGLEPEAARRRGLADAASVPAEHLIVETTHPRLAFVGPGRARADAFEALAGPGAERLFAALARRAGRVVIDAAPVLDRPDALALARLVDRVALVVRAGRTSERDVRAALAALPAARTALVIDGCEALR